MGKEKEPDKRNRERVGKKNMKETENARKSEAYHLTLPVTVRFRPEWLDIFL